MIKNIIEILKPLLHYFSHQLHNPNTSYGAILMLHRIDKPDENGIWYNEHLKMSPQVIEEMADYARRKGCKFVSLPEITRKPHFWENPRKLIAVTLDDGYSDNYSNGVPVFQKLNIPYLIYVCTKMVEGKMLYWWEILEWLIVREKQIIINLPDGTEHIFDCSTKDKKEQTFLDIREIIIRMPQGNLLEQIKMMLCRYDIDYNFGKDHLGLTWNQIAEMIQDPLCTIGNHSYSHFAFTGCEDEEIKADIHRASVEMKERTGYDMYHFAFPFGEAIAVSRHDVELVKQLGYVTSATTRDGFICYGTDKLELPRVFITEKNWKDVIDRIVKYC